MTVVRMCDAYSHNVVVLACTNNGCGYTGAFEVERVEGIEPSYAAWKAAVLPLNYTRFRRRKSYPARLPCQFAAASLCPR
jgi:hypothetical protein